MTRLAPWLVALALLDGCVWSSPVSRVRLTAGAFEHPGIDFRVPVHGDAEHFISPEWRVKHPLDLWGRPTPNPVAGGELTIEHLATGSEIWLGVIDMMDEDVQALPLDSIAERVLRAAQEPEWGSGRGYKGWGYRGPIRSFDLEVRDRAELTITGREAYGLLVDVIPTDRSQDGAAARAMFVFVRTNDLSPYRRGRQTRGVPALIIAGMAAPIQHFDRVAPDFARFLASFELPPHERTASTSSEPATETPAAPPAVEPAAPAGRTTPEGAI